MAFTIIAQTPAMARELARHDRAEQKRLAARIRRALREQGDRRYLVIDAGFPAVRYLVWDRLRGDNLRGEQLPGNPRHPWFVGRATALRVACRLNAADQRSESLSYGVRCLACGEWETACRCEAT
jgi:hypothetical protein